MPKQCRAEALGTYLLILFGCGAVHASVLTGHRADGGRSRSYRRSPSPEFVATAKRLLGEPTPVVVIIALRGGGLIAEVKKPSGVQIEEVTYGKSAGATRGGWPPGSSNARLTRILPEIR
jgi:hypothetical protein